VRLAGSGPTVQIKTSVLSHRHAPNPITNHLEALLKFRQRPILLNL
jgi:hypothetical protein